MITLFSIVVVPGRAVAVEAARAVAEDGVVDDLGVAEQHAVAVEAARQVTLDVVADDDGIAAEDAVAVRGQTSRCH